MAIYLPSDVGSIYESKIIAAAYPIFMIDFICFVATAAQSCNRRVSTCLRLSLGLLAYSRIIHFADRCLNFDAIEITHDFFSRWVWLKKRGCLHANHNCSGVGQRIF